METKLEILKTSIINEIRNNATRSKPITSTNLCSNFNISFRILKEVLTDLRKDGYPIVAKETDGGGYWLAESEDDIMNYISMIQRRKKGYEETIKVMDECLLNFNHIPYIE